MSGLTRRRGNMGAGGVTGSEGDVMTASSAGIPAAAAGPTTTGGSAGGRAVSVSTLTADGTRLAWDPTEILEGADRDVTDGGANRSPRLTLMEEVLLLGLKDKQGYLSFWNDSLSYVLRGCILMELALRGRIAMVPSNDRKRLHLQDRPICVVNTRPTGEVLLDETLRLIRQTQDGTFSASAAPPTGTDYTNGASSAKFASASAPPPTASNGRRGSTASQFGQGGDGPGEYWSIATWMDLLSGETWNILRVSYQLRQVRERLAKGLVDKGVLRTERRSFVIFDMATHPVADTACKDEIATRVLTTLRGSPGTAAWSTGTTLRTVALVAAAHSGNVLENVLARLPTLGEREAAWSRADDLLVAFARWDDAAVQGQPVVVNGVEQLEIVAAIVSVFARMDSLL
ncbi:hypothetical protein H9P43_001958 [Blastocladiella emersonii ATCC 22665]|nr:hypothetical protein H9P43_001958 [Blastocladiella emersonii ATCC 22665]